MTRVILAVSGSSGAGKTRLIEALAHARPDALRLHFDDYVSLGNDVAEIKAWLAAGADPDAIRSPRLAKDLAKLARAPLVILEEPFGKARREIAGFVTHAVHIEVPPEVALARRLLRAIRDEFEPGDPALVASLEGQLAAFLAIGREAYAAADRAARSCADLIVDGLQPSGTIAAAVLAAIEIAGEKP
ncbi:hypothetical protein AB2M62_01870 [Sphingomonas sp. MMS12-HWE2-04]|uniref:hypothetical protein n=1 Tax=Sphingomonas sp. MMS12-HWE2-04 TaxID=3234199 RepID=UPI00384A5BA7